MWRFPLGRRFPVNFRPPPASPDRIEGIFVLTKLWASFWYIEIGFWWMFEKNPNFGYKGVFRDFTIHALNWIISEIKC